MQITVETDIERAIAQLKSITEAQQLKFAVAKALTQTAYDVQKEVRANMPGRFILRRQWIVQGIKVDKATKEDLTALVYSKDKFMALQESGGMKGALRNYIAIPTSMVKRTKTDVIAKSDRPGALGDKAEIIHMNGHAWLALKKARKAGNGQRLKLLYLLVPKAQMKAKLGLDKDGQRVVRAKFAGNLEDALAQAVRTAR
jgi:hypothetical protein